MSSFILEYEARRRLYIHYFNINEGNGLVPFKLEICKLKRIRKVVGKRCPLCKEEQNEVHALWKCEWIQTQEEIFLSNIF